MKMIEKKTARKWLKLLFNCYNIFYIKSRHIFDEIFFKLNFMKFFYKILLLALVLSSCSSKEEKIDKEDYKQQKESLADKEKRSPKSFLEISGTYKRNIWGKTVYKAEIKNTASICSYKNVRVKLLYFKEGVQVTNHEELIEESISPNSIFDFKAKYKTPKGTDSVAAYIMSAVVDK